MKKQTVQKITFCTAIIGMLSFQSCNTESIAPTAVLDETSTETISLANARAGQSGSTSSTINVVVAQANLLTAISTYLNTKYAGYTFTNAYSEANTSGVIVNYDVNIVHNSVAYHVVFDAVGAFVSVRTGGHKGGAGTTNVAVTQANLLAAISTYLTTNYASYTFTNAYSEANTSGVIVNYDVNIVHNSIAYHVVFDAAGTFVNVGTAKNGGNKTVNVAVIQADLKSAISTYLTTNYAGYTFVNAYSEANTTGTILNYDVNIISNSINYHVVFDAAGAFVRVSNGGKGNNGSKGKGH